MEIKNNSIRMGKTFLRILFKYDTVWGPDLWLRFIKVMEKENENLLHGLDVFGRKVKKGKILSCISKNSYFEVKNRSFLFRFGRDGTRKYDDAWLVSDAISSETVQELAWSLMHEDSALYAWNIDNEYNIWQNATDLDRYLSVGRTIEGLPLISNGLSKPLTKMIVDTSKNPGRFVFHQGYIEAVGGVMWFANDFFPLTGADKSELLRMPFLQTEEREDILKITLDPNLLADAEGDIEMEAKQDALRVILFPKTARRN